MKSLSLNTPHLLIMVGIPGSGKSLFAAKFASTFNAPLIDYSVVMEIAGQNSDVSDVFAGYALKELFKTKQVIIFDGPTASRAERTALKDLAAHHGYDSLFIWTQTDVDTAKTRYIKAHREKGRTISANEYGALIKNFSVPVAKEHPTVVVSGKHTFATQLKAVLKNLTATKQMVRASETPKPRDGVSIIVNKRNRNIPIQ